jgi:ComF family protein
LADEIAQRQGAAVRKLSPAALVPIPLHPSREYVRGYNQAALFASELAPLIDMPVDGNLLIRLKKRRPQARLKQARRATNIRGAFVLAPDYTSEEHAERVILVDDVVTSGQTIFEARRTLARAGLSVVGAIAIAHRM